MVTQINELRVVMDTSSYEAGVKTIETTSAQAGAAQKALTATVQESSAKISQAGDWVEKLKRKYVDGYASAQAFARELDAVGRAVDLGRIKGEQLSAALDGVYRRYGMMADISQLVAKNQLDLARAAEVANQRFQQQRNIMPANRNEFAAVNTANIAAQFQDIGVTAAMGMSPLQIALQQGTQLSAVLGPMGAGGAVRSLGTALASLVTPVSLITVGLVAAAAAAIQYLGPLIMQGEAANEKIKAQRDLISEVAGKWGEALPALKAYNDEQQRGQDLAKQHEAVTAAISLTWDGARQQVSDYGDEVQDAISKLQMAGTSGEDMIAVQNVWNNLVTRVQAGKATFEDVRNAQTTLNLALRQQGMEVESLSGLWANLTRIVDEASGRSRQLLGDLANPLAENEALLKQGQPYTDAMLKLQEYYRSQYNPVPDMPNGIPTPTPRPKIELEGLDSDAKAAGATSNLVEQIKARQQLFQTQQQQIEQLQLEASLVGKTASERARATAALQAEQQLRQQGINLLSQEGQAYRDNAVAMAEARVQIERSQAAYASYQQAGSSAIDALTASTGSLQDRLKGAADAMLSWITQMALANPLKNAMFGTNLPTLADLGKPAVPAGLTPTSTGSMMVTAGTVMINGGVTGGQFPGIPGVTPGASTTSGTLGDVLGFRSAANVNGVRPDLTAGGLVNSPVASAINPTDRAMMYRQAISKIESGSYDGNYSALGPITRTGDRAYGRYQVMGNNVPSWTEQHYGQKLTPSQFHSNPAAQDAVFDGEFGSYVSKYGEGPAATKWFTGSHVAKGRSDVLGTTDHSYSNQFNANMQKLSQTSATASKDIGTLGDSSMSSATQLTDSLGKLSSTAAVPAVPAVAPATTAAAPAGGGNIFSSLFGGIFKLFGFADGTAFSPGGVALVGERGPELVNLPRGSQVVPNHRMQGPNSEERMRGQVVRHDYSISVSGMGDKDLLEKMRIAAEEATRRGLSSYDAVLPDRVEAIRQNPEFRMSA